MLAEGPDGGAPLPEGAAPQVQFPKPSTHCTYADQEGAKSVIKSLESRIRVSVKLHNKTGFSVDYLW